MNKLFFEKSRIESTLNEEPLMETVGSEPPVPEMNLRNLETIIIFPYNECNLACRMCPVKNPIRVDKAFRADPNEFEWHISDEGVEWLSSLNPRSYTILGGEPLISKTTMMIMEKLQGGDSKAQERYHKSMYDKLDAIGKNIVMYTNGQLITKETIDILSVIDRLSIVVSLEGDRDYTNYIRGPGVFERAMEAIKLLRERDIPVTIRVGYSQENIKSVFSLMRKVGNHIPMEFAPRIDKPPLPKRLARNLYYAVASLPHADILQPSYKNFVGFDRRCPAGIKRFTVHPDDSITACQWGSEVVAKAGDDDDFLKEAMRSWVARNTRIEPECIGCKKATVCYSSCRVSKDYKQCPTKDSELDRAVVENLFDRAVEVTKEKTMKAIKSMRNISMAGC